MSHYNGCGCGGGCNSCTSHNEIQQAVNDALAFEKENLEQYETNAAQSATDAAKEAAKAAESASAAAQSQTNAETAASTATQAASSVTNTAVVLEETAERIEQAQDLLEEQISAIQTKPVYFEVSTPTSSLVLPETETVFNVRSIYIASARQDVGYGFTFDKATRTITLADEITADDIAEVEEGFILVTAICDVYSSDDPTSFPIILASDAGASNVGTSSGKTVQEMLDNTMTKDDASLAYSNDVNNLFQEAVSLTFGDDDNAATLHVDTRGRLSVSSSANGMPMAQRVSVPFSEATGYYKGPFPDTLVKFPTSDEPDDFKSYCMLMSYDAKRNIPRLLIGSPHTTNFHGYVQSKRTWGAPVNQMLEVAPLSLIGRSLINSYDTYFKLDSSTKNYYKLASISNASNAAGAFLSCILNIGDYTLKDRSTYLLNVQTPVYNTTLSTATIMDMVKLTCIDGANSASTIAGTARPTATTLVVGLVATDTGYDVWLALPAHSTYFSCTVLNAGNSDLVSFDWSTLKSDSGLSTLSGSPAANTVWAPCDVVMDSRRVVSLNDGSLFYVPEGYAMLRVYSNQTAAALDSRFQWVSSFCRRSVVDSASASASLGCTVSSYTYTITGCNLATDQGVYIRPPRGYSSMERWSIRLDSNDTSANTFSFTLLKRTVTAATTYDSTTSAYTTTLTEGTAGASIPTDTWIDVLVKLV